MVENTIETALGLAASYQVEMLHEEDLVAVCHRHLVKLIVCQTRAAMLGCVGDRDDEGWAWLLLVSGEV